MNKIYKQIQKQKKKEIREIRRDFKEEVLKAAAFSVGGEFRSIEVDVANAVTFPIFVEFKSILLPEDNSEDEFARLEGFEPLAALTKLTRAGLSNGIVVSTDREFAGGDPSWINLIKNNSELAVMQRDFFMDPAQMYQGKAIGADAFLVNADFPEEKRLSGILEAGNEMGLEVYLELFRWQLPETINAELLNGVVLNLSRSAAAEVQMENADKFLRSLPVSLVKFARFYPRSEDEIRAVQVAGFQAIILNDELWKKGDFVNHLHQIHSWCANILTNGQAK
jgi:indole-3-glycerol phosphate synthase